MASRKRPKPKVYELRIELDGIVPSVWRRIIVPGTITLPELHDLLQLVMGWTDSHLHSFTIGKHTYSSKAGNGDLAEMKMIDESGHALVDLLGESVKTFLYEYDFGDSWEHVLEFEGAHPREPHARYPRCLAGARACPPEDVGGTSGYEDFLAVIADPEHEEHEDMLHWAGGSFDSEAFSAERICFDDPRMRWRLAFARG